MAIVGGGPTGMAAGYFLGRAGVPVTIFEKENSLYSLLVGIKPANLNLWASRPLDKDETDCVRAAYIREYLPQICSWS